MFFSQLNPLDSEHGSRQSGREQLSNTNQKRLLQQSGEGRVKRSYFDGRFDDFTRSNMSSVINISSETNIHVETLN